jgi:hypothetical protein
MMLMTKEPGDEEQESDILFNFMLVSFFPSTAMQCASE